MACFVSFRSHVVADSRRAWDMRKGMVHDDARIWSNIDVFNLSSTSRLFPLLQCYLLYFVPSSFLMPPVLLCSSRMWRNRCGSDSEAAGLCANGRGILPRRGACEGPGGNQRRSQTLEFSLSVSTSLSLVDFVRAGARSVRRALPTRPVPHCTFIPR